MAQGRQGSGADLSSSDEEDSPAGRAGARQPGVAAGALLERCAPAALGSHEPKEESEGVFEIRDFTTASSFERIAHKITLAAKKWAGVLKADAAEDGQLLREEFEHMDFRYDLLFQLAQRDAPVLPASKGGSADRLGLHSFPARAHRLTRWFGVHHFVIVGVKGQNIDPDSARTVLSALVLGVQGVAAALPQPLACFVPVDGGRRRRYLGELASGGRRTLFTTDSATAVQPSLEHLEGLSEFFHQKLGDGSQETPMVGVRFTYLADAFDPMTWNMAGERTSEVEQTPAVPEGATLDRDESDPVDTMQLHCLWPSFPQGSFADNAVFSELDPRSAPYWKLRVLRAEGAQLPLTRLLRNLLEFRKEARTVRSAEHSMQPQLPKTALASLSNAIQESLESILLPTPGEMKEQLDACMACPIVAAAASGRPAGEVQSAGLCGGLRGTRLAKIAELSAKMRCFKGSVMLWCQVLACMRQQWEALAKPLPHEASAATRRVGARGVRAELFDPAVCLAQQKFEMLQRSAEAVRGGRLLAEPAGPVREGLRIQATGAPLAAPQLKQPALMTEDMVVQQDMAAASISEPAERAELWIRELQSDASAFKAANPGAELEDFLAWRTEVEHLSLEPFPAEWLARVWQQAPAEPADQQSVRLFEPGREAEMALHYLENIDGTQLLLQIFRVQLRATLEELSSSSAGSESAHLRVLRDRAVSACLSAFAAAGVEDVEGGSEEEDAGAAAAVAEAAAFPSDGALQGALAALEALEAAVRLAASLCTKLPAAGGSLVDELLMEGEASAASPSQRRAVEALFERGRVLAQAQGREPPDGKGVFECLPLAKEFLLQLQPSEGGDAPRSGAPRRLYAEVRERHLRLAIARSFRMT